MTLRRWRTRSRRSTCSRATLGLPTAGSGACSRSSAAWSGLPPPRRSSHAALPSSDWAGAGNEALYAHARTIRAPRVVVVKDLDDPPAHGSLWGEVHATIFGALGCVGCVTDGAVRDLDEARAMGFHFFASGPSVSHAYVRVETVGEPVEIGGLLVAPGDLLHADQHGVLKIPREIAAELPAAADRVIESEQALLRWVRSDDFDPERLAEMRARH